MNWNFVRTRAVSAMIASTLFGCGGTDPNLLNGYWMVSRVETQGLSSSHRQEEWHVQPDAAYVLSFQGSQMVVPSFGLGTQEFQLPDQRTPYQMEDDRITMGGSVGPSNGYAPLEIVDVDDERLTLAQTVATQDRGNVRVQQEFERVGPDRVRNLMMRRNEPLPPELQAGYGGNPQYGNPQYGNPNMQGHPGMGQPPMQAGPQVRGPNPQFGPQVGPQFGPQVGPQGVNPQNGGIVPPGQRGYVPLDVPPGANIPSAQPRVQPQYQPQFQPQTGNPNLGPNGGPIGGPSAGPANGGYLPQGQGPQGVQNLPQDALQTGGAQQGFGVPSAR